MSCLLNIPLEIFHTIFDYLEAYDLLYAFSELNSHLDTILSLYIRIQLNFKSIKKSTLYFICEHVHPNQIQSLILSNDEYTPGQIKLFMSLLPLIQFNNLQYLNINQIQDANLFYLILSHLENHTRIHSILISGYAISINKRNSRSIAEILTTLPSLKHLTLMDSSLLATLQQPLSKLTHLTISSCVRNDLRIIFPWIPNLVYLNISVPFGDHAPIFDYIPIYLSSLILKLKSWTLFTELENLFSLTPSLKHLILETMGEQALLDGRRWEILIKTKLLHLKELALNITPEENNMTGDDVLIPFQNSFWTNEKHCHMACLISCMTQSCARLFSVPHFATIDDWYPVSEGFINYSLTPYAFHDNYTELRVAFFPTHVLIPSPFEHIQNLLLECTTDNINQLHNIVNLLSVNHLKFPRSVQCPAFHDILQAAPNINQLTMNLKTLLQIIDSLPHDHCVYNQIKKLNTSESILSMDIDRICQIFPKLEHISLCLKEREDILYVFNSFHSLISATIYWNCSVKISQTTIDKLLQENNICTDGTYEFGRSSLCVWID